MRRKRFLGMEEQIQTIEEFLLDAGYYLSSAGFEILWVNFPWECHSHFGIAPMTDIQTVSQAPAMPPSWNPSHLFILGLIRFAFVQPVGERSDRKRQSSSARAISPRANASSAASNRLAMALSSTLNPSAAGTGAGQ
jgi:hypothetical protein